MTSVSRILVVEDEALIAEDLKTTLQELRYQPVATVSTGEQAVQKAEELKPDLILMDIRLKGVMDGIEAAEQIHRRFAIPVVFLSAASNRLSVERLKITEPYGFVSKPFDPSELHRIVELALYKHGREKRLRERFERYQTLVRESPDAIAFVERDGRFIDVNLRFSDLLGYSRDEILSMNARHIWADPNDRSAWQKDMGKTGFVKDYEALMRRKDGTVKACRINSKEWRSEDGRTQYLGVLRDMTELKLAEQRIAEAHEFNVKILGSSPVGISTYRSDGQCVSANEAIASLAGATREQMLSQNFRTIDWWKASGLLADAEEVLSRGSDKQRAIHVVTTFGKEVWLDCRLSRFVYHNTPHLLFMTNDITELKRTEQELKRSHDELEQRVEERTEELKSSKDTIEALLNATTDIVLLLDRKGIIVAINEAGGRFLGKSSSELLGESIFGLVSEETASLGKEKTAQVLRTGRPAYLEHEQRKSHFEITIYPVSQDDRFQHVAIYARDITERKLAQQTLKEREERFRSTFEQAAVGMAHVSPEGRFIRINQKFCDIVGYERDELIRLTFQDITHPDDLEADLEYFRQVLADKINTYFMEKRYIRKDGSVVWVNLTVSLTRDTGGNPDYFIAVVEDISRRKGADAALRRMSKVFMEASDPIMIEDLDGIIVDLNQEAERTYEWRREELIGKSIKTVVPPHSHEQWETLMAQCKQGNAVRNVETLRRTRTAEDIPILMSIFLLTDEKGEPAGLASIAKNLRELKRVEEELRESEARYRLLVDNAPIGILSCDLEGRINDVNWKLLEILGSPSAEATKSINMFTFPPLVEAGVSEACKRCIENGETTSFEAPYTSKWGKRSHLGVVLTPMQGPGGSVCGVQAVVEDITDRKKIESQLLHAQKMEAIGTLAGGIAHDFNNLLTIISGYTEMLMLNKEKNDQDYGDLKAVHRAAARGADLVKRILTFSRTLESRPRPMNLNNQVRQAEKLLSKTIPKMVKIELILADDLRNINADPIQIDQILLNLAVNAGQAMLEGGKLRFQTQNVTLDAEYCKTHIDAKPGENVLLMVSDTGHGMDSTIVRRIFEPFFSTKDPAEGTGLGLSVVFGIVQSHGGHITCYSEPGIGTTFKIYFPAIRDREEDLDVSESDEMHALGTETILFVDDENAIRSLGERILQKAGYTVLTAANGNEALQLYERERKRISLVVLDLIMPGMGGKQCLDEILRIDPQAKVILTSGFSLDVETKLAFKSGTIGFVNKPFKMRELLQTVRAVLDEK